MDWLENKILTTSAGVEPVTALLLECGVSGVMIDDAAEIAAFIRGNPLHWDYVDEDLLAQTSQNPSGAAVVFYVADAPYGYETLEQVKSGLAALSAMDDLGLDLGSLSLSGKLVNDEDWLNKWKESYKPFPIGEKIMVRPVWETAEPQSGSACRADRLIFTINPGNVFGTGLHQTTQLCVEQLEKLVTPRTDLLDLGCGSGILSVIGLLLGARSALGCDLDPSAAGVVRENAALNRIPRERLTVLTGNALTDQELRAAIREKQYNLVVANIVADVIIGLAGFASECLPEGGVMVASGVIGERLREVLAALRRAGFTVDEEDITARDDWYCVKAVKHA